jgi:thiol-disulfide isomerase/thioredoxin
MLVFWASWCGPCRLEIPDLIKLESVYQNKRFYMASISIDQNPSLWHKAIVEDKPTWDQFLVEKQDITKIMARYKFSSIPLVVFTDKNGKELIRFSGYRPNQFTDYIKIIKKFSTQD